MKTQLNEIKRMQQLAGVINEFQLNENINNILTAGGFDPIDDEDLLEKATRVLSLIGGNPSANAVNAVVMAIEDAEGEDYDKSVKRLDTFKDKLKKFRSSGLEKDGEFSYENLVFKFLRRNGYIQKLFDFKNKLIDKNLSVENTDVE